MPTPSHAAHDGAPVRLRQFAESLRELTAGQSVDQALQKAVDLATELIDGIDVADVMFARPGGVTTPVSSDPIAEQLDQAQQEAGHGPCLSTLESDDRVVCHDLAEDDRWPGFSEVAVDLGYRAVAAHRLFVDRGGDEVRFGALNLFGQQPDLDELDIEMGAVFAAHCSTVLHAAINEEGLQRALQSRDVIGQAKGILMARHCIRAEDAYEMLRSASNNRNTKLRELAREVTELGEIRGA